MPRGRRPHLKQRKDGRYCKVYKGQQIMGNSEDEVYDRYDEIVRLESEGMRRPVTVGEFAQSWLPIAFPSVRDSTYRGLATHMQKLVDVLGMEKLSQVVPSMIKRVYAEKYSGMSNSYIKSGRQLFCSLFDAAVADGYCRSNPARDRTASPAKGKPVKEVKFTAQHRKWIETLCTDHRCHAIVMTMLYAGLRPQEAKALDITRDVDFKNDIITVQSTAHVNGQKYDFTDDMKTGWSERKVPLFPPLKTALMGKEGHLITTAHGKQITIQTWKVAWNSYKHCMETAINGMDKRWYGRTKEHKKILAEGKPLPAWIEFNITPYTLRKAFCRWCRDNKVELNCCIRWMGHKDATMILKVYDEASDDRSAAEAERLNSLFDMQNDMQSESPEPASVDI
jgi:integrase